jgi:hypothetical protein
VAINLFLDNPNSPPCPSVKVQSRQLLVFIFGYLKFILYFLYERLPIIYDHFPESVLKLLLLV